MCIRDSNSIENNTIFARQYEILNINDNNISNENDVKQDIKDNQVLSDKGRQVRRGHQVCRCGR